jgi:hypothetical protein
MIMSAHPLFVRGVVGAAVAFGSGSLFGCGSGIDTPSEEPANPPANSFVTPSTSNTPSTSTSTPPTTTPVQSTPETQATPVRVNPSTAPTTALAWQPPTSIDPNTPVGQHGQLRVQGTALVDKSGAPVQLKGISSMWLNWEDRYSTSKAGLQWMRDNWNITIFRAAMGVEPDGAYLKDQARALSGLRQVVHNAIDLGVYVLIDWHDHHAFDHQAQAVDFFTKIAEEFGRPSTSPSRRIGRRRSSRITRPQ